jgi:hypothetical protein
MQPISIRFGGYQSPASVHNKAAEVLGQALAARLGAGVRFDLEGNVIRVSTDRLYGFGHSMALGRMA